MAKMGILGVYFRSDQPVLVAHQWLNFIYLCIYVCVYGWMDGWMYINKNFLVKQRDGEWLLHRQSSPSLVRFTFFIEDHPVEG